MKGYISVSIPVKKYVSAFIENELGTPLILSTRKNVVFNKLYDLLEPKMDRRLNKMLLSNIEAEMQLSEKQKNVYFQLYNMLDCPNNNPEKNKASCNYNSQIKVFISIQLYNKKGSKLNNTNVKQFNRFVELLIKEKFYSLMDILITTRKGFEANIPYVREKLGIDIDSWSDDSMKKDYYRYRIRKTTMPYKKTA